MIDEDPGAAQPAYLQELHLMSDEHGVRILRDDKRDHRVIVLQPRLEEWIIATAAAARLAPEDSGLSAQANELHKEINFRLAAFARLIRALITARSGRLAHLKTALNVETSKESRPESS